MDEPNEQQLYAWLRARGKSGEEVTTTIEEVDEAGSATVFLDSAL
jgi:hypothetical protein